MTYLIDTHVLIWSLVDDKKLSDTVREILENPENTILVSSISLWEISLKFSLRKLDLQGITPGDFPKLIQEIGFELTLVQPDEVSTYHLLKGEWHRDPFDRMLIWQVIKRKVILISKDENIAKYANEGLKVVW